MSRITKREKVIREVIKLLKQQRKPLTAKEIVFELYSRGLVRSGYRLNSFHIAQYLKNHKKIKNTIIRIKGKPVKAYYYDDKSF